jgi:hypothetical protein
VVPDRREPRPPADEFGDKRLRRCVDRRRGVLLLRAQDAQETFRHPAPGAVERRAARQIHRDPVRACDLERVLHPSGEVVQHGVPADLLAAHRGPIEAPGIVVKGRESTPFRARVALRQRMLGVPAHPHHAFTLDRHKDAAHRVADPAEARLLHPLPCHGNIIHPWRMQRCRVARSRRRDNASAALPILNGSQHGIPGAG